MFMEPIKINIYGNSFALWINIFYYTVQKKNTITKQEALLNACVQTESVSKREQQDKQRLTSYK